MKIEILILALLHALTSVLCKTDVIDNNLVISKVERKIDIATHLVKTDTIITVENKGSSSVRSFLFAVEPSLKKNIAFVKATVGILIPKKDFQWQDLRYGCRYSQHPVLLHC